MSSDGQKTDSSFSVWVGVGPLDSSYDCDRTNTVFFKSTIFQKKSWSYTWCLGVYANWECNQCLDTDRGVKKKTTCNVQRSHTAVYWLAWQWLCWIFWENLAPVWASHVLLTIIFQSQHVASVSLTNNYLLTFEKHWRLFNNFYCLCEGISRILTAFLKINIPSVTR